MPRSGHQSDSRGPLDIGGGGGGKKLKHFHLPPFAYFPFKIDTSQMLENIQRHPHPTDVVLDASVFAASRLSLVRQLKYYFAPIILPCVEGELEDLKTKPDLKELADLVFRDGHLDRPFKKDTFGVLQTYPRVSTRYINLLRWRKEMIEKRIRRIARDTGVEPTGDDRAKLIRDLQAQGLSLATLKLANKEHRSDRVADEVLAMFAILSPIVTGRDCFLLTADRDILEQVYRLAELLFDDYGAFLIARDFVANGARYQHQHEYKSPLVAGAALAIGREADPTYLLPPLLMMNTCATTVVDVNRMEGFTWIATRNMEPAIAFQDVDPLGRKGDPGNGRSILFSVPMDRGSGCPEKTNHFVIGTPTNLNVSNTEFGPIPLDDLIRANTEQYENATTKKRRVWTPNDHRLHQLVTRLERVLKSDP